MTETKFYTFKGVALGLIASEIPEGMPYADRFKPGTGGLWGGYLTDAEIAEVDKFMAERRAGSK